MRISPPETRFHQMYLLQIRLCVMTVHIKIPFAVQVKWVSFTFSTDGFLTQKNVHYIACANFGIGTLALANSAICMLLAKEHI